MIPALIALGVLVVAVLSFVVYRLLAQQRRPPEEIRVVFPARTAARADNAVTAEAAPTNSKATQPEVMPTWLATESGALLPDTDGVDGTLQFLPGRLQIVSGWDRRGEIKFVRVPGADTVTFGRNARPGHPHTHVQVGSPTVSRMHARLRFRDGRWLISNLSTTNPVVLNGQPVNSGETMLQDGDEVEMGEVVFRFKDH